MATSDLDVFQLPVFRIGRDARILGVNSAACSYLDYSEQELVRMTLLDIDPNLTREIWDASFERKCMEASTRIETLHKTKAGEVLPVTVVCSFAETGGEPYFFASVILNGH